MSGPSLEAIINLRFIFIGEFESRLTLAKQGGPGRPWTRLNAGEYFCRKALQAEPALNLLLRLQLLAEWREGKI